MTSPSNQNNQGDQTPRLRLTPEEMDKLTEDLDEFSRFDDDLLTVDERASFLAKLYSDEDKCAELSDMFDEGFLSLPEDDDLQESPAPAKSVVAQASSVGLPPRWNENPRVLRRLLALSTSVCILCVLGSLLLIGRNSTDAPVDSPAPIAHVVNPTPGIADPGAIIGAPGEETGENLLADNRNQGNNTLTLSLSPGESGSQSQNLNDTVFRLDDVIGEIERLNANRDVALAEAHKKEIDSIAKSFDSSSDDGKWRKISKLLRLGAFQEARVAWNSLPMPLKDGFNGKTCQGILFYFEENRDEAEKALREALEMRPDDPIAKANLEVVLAPVEKTDKSDGDEL